MGKGRVKNALRPHETELEIEEDMGIPGKIYFEKPQLSLVKAFHKSDLPEYDTGGYGMSRQAPGPVDLYTREGPVRLPSSKHMDNHTYKVPEKVHYLLTQRPSNTDIVEYISIQKADGFAEGAVVSRRHQAEWRFKWYTYWGIITRVHGNCPLPSKEAYAPFRVKWFNPEHNVTDEDAWAEDLVVIHAALDKETLASILEEQGV